MEYFVCIFRLTNLYMCVFKVTCCCCTLAIIYTAIVSCLWLVRLIGIISMGNEYQLPWENKKSFDFCSLFMFWGGKLLLIQFEKCW